MNWVKLTPLEATEEGRLGLATAALLVLLMAIELPLQ